MPTYEYKCSACGHEFEEFQPISAKPIRKCPQCRKLAVDRLISTGGGIIFRGSGFYATDYRSDNYKAGVKKESDAGKPSAPADAKSGGVGKNNAAPAGTEKAAVAEAPASKPPSKPENKMRKTEN